MYSTRSAVVSSIGRLKAQKTNPEVISYVAKTPAALGVIGVNWIGNPADSTRLSFNDAIRIMAVSRADSATVENSFSLIKLIWL